MGDDNWSVGEKVHVTSRLPPSPALDYVAPEIFKVAVEVRSDEGFEPVYGKNKSSISLLANVLSGEIVLSSGHSERVDCGFSMKVPAGYRLNATGLMPGLFVALEDSKRIIATVFNAGDEVVLKHRGAFARMWIEPAYFFEWK